MVALPPAYRIAQAFEPAGPSVFAGSPRSIFAMPPTGSVYADPGKVPDYEPMIRAAQARAPQPTSTSWGARLGRIGDALADISAFMPVMTARTRPEQRQALGDWQQYRVATRADRRQEREAIDTRAALQAYAKDNLGWDDATIAQLDGAGILDKAVSSGELPGTPAAPTYGFNEVGGTLLRTDPQSGEATPIYESPTAGEAKPRFGWEVGPDGRATPTPGGPNDPAYLSEAAAARGQGRPQRPLPQSAVNKMTDAGASLDAFDRLSTTFEDSYGGKVVDTLGAAQNWAGRNLPGGITGGENAYADQAQFWQDYQTTKNTIRHTLFGSALTATEKAEFDKANISPGMTPETIKSNLARQKAASIRAAQKLAGVYQAQGYPPEAIEAALGYSLEDLGTTPPAGFGAPPEDGGAGASGTTSSGVQWSIEP